MITIGGQGPKSIRIDKKHRKYLRTIQKELSDKKIRKAAGAASILATVTTGHAEIGAGIKAIAEGYIEYRKSGSLGRATYAGVKTFTLETTPGYIAGKAVHAVESATGIQLSQGVESALQSGIERGVSYAEEKGFKFAEGMMK